MKQFYISLLTILLTTHISSAESAEYKVEKYDAEEISRQISEARRYYERKIMLNATVTILIKSIPLNKLLNEIRKQEGLESTTFKEMIDTIRRLSLNKIF